ncbi:iron-sulfur cluster repair di-iron protein [soil metagenome]
MTLLLRKTVGELVVERPARAKVFESLGIDFCCGGRKTLEQACHEQAMDPTVVQNVLNLFDVQGDSAGKSENDWSVASLTELVTHIEATHHAYLKREFPQLGAWVKKIGARHGEHDPRLVKLATVFEVFVAELTSHMEKEEKVLFPLCRALEAGNFNSINSHCGSIRNPISAMLAEHDDAGDALEQMSELTNGFVAPPDACNTFRAMLDGLAQLRRDMHQHVHKENNILFPKAIELESRLTGRTTEVVGA